MVTQSIDDVPLLVRREIEARILSEFVNDLSETIDRETVVETLSQTIRRVARQQGQALAESCGGDHDLPTFKQVTDKWREGGALELTVLQSSDDYLSFDVTRCRYAEMYHRLGIPELGRVLSCDRDFTASEGFNPNLKLTRTQTIMDGGPHCDFRYELAD
jgi:hypothetical protein